MSIEKEKATCIQLLKLINVMNYAEHLRLIQVLKNDFCIDEDSKLEDSKLEDTDEHLGLCQETYLPEFKQPAPDNLRGGVQELTKLKDYVIL